MMIVGDELQRRQEYVDRLREELGKIIVFRRELPLCLELVTQVIEKLSNDGPVFEEFMPPSKRNSCSDDDDEHGCHKSKKGLHNNNGMCDEKSLKKLDWLESAQLSLWNQTNLDPPKKEKVTVPVPVRGVKRNGGGGAFHPFKRETVDRTCPTPGTEVGEISKKARRCWSPELHRLFLQALQQLGGSHVATPKQIREMMKINGLTNDEVKSHLQKYRLHTRSRSGPSICNTNHNPQTPHDERKGEFALPCKQDQRQLHVKQLRLSGSDSEDSNSLWSSSSQENILRDKKSNF